MKKKGQWFCGAAFLEDDKLVSRYWEDRKPKDVSLLEDEWVYFKHDHLFDVMDRQGKKKYRDLDIFDLDALAHRCVRDAIKYGRFKTGGKCVQLLFTVTEKRRDIYIKKGGRLDRDKRYESQYSEFDPSPQELEELRRKKEIYMVDRIKIRESNVLQQSFEQILSSPREVRSLFCKEKKSNTGTMEEEILKQDNDPSGKLVYRVDCKKKAVNG